MTTADAARELGMSSEYVRGEIKDGRMKANVTDRPGKRAVYRITPAQLAEYKSRHWRPDGSDVTITEPIPRSSLCREIGCVGLRSCAACRRIYSRENRPSHSELSPEERAKANARAYANTYQRRGKLTPQPCEVCGSPDTEKHHDDYSKPLEVRWFCRAHHLAIPRGKLSQPSQ